MVLVGEVTVLCSEMELSGFSVEWLHRFALYRCWELRNRAPSAGPIWPVRTWSATGRCFRAGRPEAATPRRTRDARSQCHCMQIPIENESSLRNHVAPSSLGNYQVYLFTRAHDLFQVIVGGQSLHSCQCFATIALLDSNVYKTVLYTVVSTLDCISKGV